MEGQSKRKLFDDDDEEEQLGKQPTTITPLDYNPGQQQQQNQYQYQEQQNYQQNQYQEPSYQPQYEQQQEEEVYKTSYDYNANQSTEPEAVKQHGSNQIQFKPVESEQEYSYNPTYEDTSNQQTTFQNKNYSGVAQERKNLFEEEQIQIDTGASASQQFNYNQSSSYSPKKQSEAPKVVDDSNLRMEADKAKNQLLQDLNKMTVTDIDFEDPVKEKEDPKVKLFSVSNPIKVAGHIKYKVSGLDSDGPFEESRRFREFFALRNALSSRWPGIYIPAIPEKKLMGNQDDKFVEERRSMLERFMKELAKFDYLTQSKEFRIFAREKGDIEKILGNLIKQTPMQVLEKYRLNFNVDEDQESSALSRYKENIIEFQTFLRKVIPVMETQKKQLKSIIQARDAQDNAYVQIIVAMLKYEDSNLEYYSENDLTKRVMTNPTVGDFREQFDNAFRKWKNPFKEAYIWLKGELLDLKGLNEALLGREQVVKQQSATESKKRNDQYELEKLSQGKTTFKSIFKTKSSKENDILNLQAAIEVANKDIEDYKKLINFLTIYHGQIAIPKFKKEKGNQYLRNLHFMSAREISNCHVSANLWHQLLEVGQQLQ